MRAIHTEGAAGLRDLYRHFAQTEASGVSPIYAQWAGGAADDDEVVERLLQLPAQKRQPNLVFAAARVHGVPVGDWSAARAHLIEHWEAISSTIMVRRTQTNEAGRIAVLNLAFSQIAQQTPRPLVLIEVGASAGLGLYPDAWPIRYTREDGEAVRLTPGGPLVSAVELVCRVEGVDPPTALPEVAWRAGIDLNPLDLTDDADRQWLQALVWPGMEYRLERIAAGAELIQRDPPRLLAGDLNEKLGEVLQQVPAGTTPVVFHSAVLAYLPAEQRQQFVDQVRSAGVRWVSNEGLTVLADIAAQLPNEDPDAAGFVLALDGEPLARTGPHGQYLRGLRR